MRLERRSLGEFQNWVWLPAVLLILVQLVSGMRDSPQGSFILIYLKEQIGLAPAAISRVVALAQIAGMVTALLGGSITARVGSKWILVSGLALSGLSSLAFLAHSPVWVPVLWLMSGAGMALTTVGGASYLTRIRAGGRLGILAAFYALSMTAGGAIGNPVAGLIVERMGFGAFSWAAMTLSGGILLTVIFFMESAQSREVQPAIGTLIWKTLRQHRVRLLVGMRSLPTIFYGVLTVLIPLLIHDLTNSKVTVALYGTITLILASGAQLLAGRAADRWGAQRPTSVAYCLLMLSGIGLAVFSGEVWGLFVFGVLGNASAWSLSTMMYVWVNDGIAKEEHPATFGLLHAVWSLSMVSGSLLAGWSASILQGLSFLAPALANFAALFLMGSFYAGRLIPGKPSHADPEGI